MMENLEQILENTRKSLVLKLPAQLQELLSKSIFDLENEVVAQDLNRYLFYMPEVIRIFGLQAAEVKKTIRDLERMLERRESQILLQTQELEAHKFKNEQLRKAKVLEDKGYQRIKETISELMFELDKLDEESWKYKNLQRALNNISEVRVSERRF